MRLFTRGALATLLICWCASLAAAEPAGEVESIGFNNVYRPGCWTPMVVRVKPGGLASGTYQLQVKQRDLDNDTAVFTRAITLTGSPDGGGRDQRFWMYFIPQPVSRGLPGAREGASLKEVQDLIEVYLCDDRGRQLVQLPVTSVPDSVDPPVSGFENRRGCRLILVVGEGASRVNWDEYRASLDASGQLFGVLEDVAFVGVRPRDLPENPLAYDAVDAVVWLDADPADLKADGGQRELALRSWVRHGGHLVISQGPNWQPTLGFGDLLPVTPEGTVTRDDPEPLRTLARPAEARAGDDVRFGPWDALKGPFRLTVATPREGAIVDEWMVVPAQVDGPATTGPSSIPPAGERRPYIVRRGYGTGAVTWVAQDLGDPALTLRAKAGWANVWERVFDWRNTPIPAAIATAADRDAFAPANGVDLGVALNTGLESGARVGLFITLAVLFFVVYWLVAGPGLFLFLNTRRQAHLSWFGYAAVALAATLLTVALVRLLLRGPPELRHQAIVRGDRSNEGQVRSRFGLYIPRDGTQRIELARPPADGTVSALSALPKHPAHVPGEVDAAGKQTYTVPVRDATSLGPPRVDVPYRSTLKQFESRWAGPIEGKIEGIAEIGPNFAGYIDGRLTNGTGRDLEHVYLAYKVPLAGRSEDWMLYLPKWPAGLTIDLQTERLGRRGDGPDDPTARPPAAIVGIDGAAPGGGRNLIGQVGVDWLAFWLSDLRGLTQLGESFWDDPRGRAPRALPMLTLFDRLPPAQVPRDRSISRVELLRRGARHLDLSPALAAGGLVIVAESADAPLPVGLKVDGDDVAGSGRIVYQFVLPTRRASGFLPDETPTGPPG